MNLRVIEYTGESALVEFGFEKEGYRWEVVDSSGRMLFAGQLKEDLVVEVPLDVEIFVYNMYRDGEVESHMIIPAKVAGIKKAAAGVLPNARLGV